MMCELLGINFEREVDVDFTIRAFALRDVVNADGWGLAWYPDQSLALAKEPLTWRESDYAGFLQTYSHVHSRMYIAHVRKKTVGGENTHADTHPFNREWLGRDYCFSHNGTVYGAEKLPLARFRPLGATDSEHVFCNLLDRIAKRGRHLDTPDDWRWLHEAFYRYNQSGKFNCQFTDGHRLFCYHDRKAFKGMWMDEVVTRPHEWEHFDDPTMHVDVEPNGVNRGVVVASLPLSRAANWQKFQATEMIAVEAGAIVYRATIVDRKAVQQPTERQAAK